jgi:hypothetical protein
VANVTEAQMEVYLRTFHEEYIATVEKYLPLEARGRLIRYSLLPAPATGYVSTQLGAGYEYGLGDADVSIRRGSRRVEDLFVDGPSWLSDIGPMFYVGGRNVGFARLTLEGGFPFRFTDDTADVYFYEVRFKADTWSRDVLFAQLFADRREEFWSEAQAVRHAKDEVLAALFDLQQSAAKHVDLGTYLQTFKERLVLILGDFKQGRDRLEAIRAALDRGGLPRRPPRRSPRGAELRPPAEVPGGRRRLSVSRLRRLNSGGPDRGDVLGRRPALSPHRPPRGRAEEHLHDAGHGTHLESRSRMELRPCDPGRCDRRGGRVG